MRHFEKRFIRGSLVALLTLMPAGVVLAVDGVIEINQARATSGGLTAGDTAKFPVTIERSGSYRLTSNLDLTDANARQNGVAAENTTAILVTASDVTIDLNGFIILGSTGCTGQPVSNCAPTGTGIGVDASAADRVTVLNGGVRGMGSKGIALRQSGLVERVFVTSNATDGIAMDGGGRLSNVDVSFNGGAGNTGAQVVTASLAIGNGDIGLGGGTVANSTANGNAGIGILGNFATGCVATTNGPGGMGTQISAASPPGHNVCNNTLCP